tara:strand:- start:12 stop:278 length:267 start_codon:yes stop_codon:yes gene_type:complete
LFIIVIPSDNSNKFPVSLIFFLFLLLLLLLVVKQARDECEDGLVGYIYEQILEIVKIISFGDSPTRIGDVLVTHTYISSASTSIILNP